MVQKKSVVIDILKLANEFILTASENSREILNVRFSNNLGLDKSLIFKNSEQDMALLKSEPSGHDKTFLKGDFERYLLMGGTSRIIELLIFKSKPI